MAHYDIKILAAGPSRRADTPEIAIHTGDTLTFQADPGAASIVCLGDAVAGIISPPPASRNIEVAGGASVSFALGNVAPGNYCIVLQAHGWPPPTSISCGSGGDGAKLTIRPADKGTYTGPDDMPVGGG